MRKYAFRSVLALVLFTALLLPLCTGAQASDLGVERKVYQYLTTELGLNSAAACGVLANIEAESNFSLTAYGDGGTSYGLCQWHNSRFESLKSFCLLRGYDYWSLEGQLDYLAYELRTRYQSTYAALKRVPDTSDGAYQAGYTWCVNFEVPANREQAGATRGRTAQLKYWVRYGGTTSEFSASMDLNSKGYSGALSDWSSLGSSFYWETEEAQPESSAPVSTPSAAAPASAAPAEEEKQADSTAPSVRVPYVRYVPHNAPVSAASGAVSREQGSPLACLFLCAGEPARRRSLPEPEEDGSPEPCA